MIASVEVVVLGVDGRKWRERWEPPQAGSGPSPMLLIKRDRKTGEAISQHGFYLKSREEVMG